MPVAVRSATLEPEPTQHSKPTFVWAYIARHVLLHLRSRVHWSQNRHNTANHICLGIHCQTRVATFKAAYTLEPEPTQQSKPTFVWAYIARHMLLHLRPRVHWSQNRHNTANQHLSGHTSPDTCCYI